MESTLIAWNQFAPLHVGEDNIATNKIAALGRAGGREGGRGERGRKMGTDLNLVHSVSPWTLISVILKSLPPLSRYSLPPPSFSVISYALKPRDNSCRKVLEQKKIHIPYVVCLTVTLATVS